MSIPLVDLKAQYARYKEEIDEAIQRVIHNAAFIMGQEVADFEADFAKFCGASHAIGVGSGTEALHMTFRAAGIGPGDEVITTPFTFIASAEMLGHLGAKPVFVDIDPKTFNIDPGKIEAAITPSTKAIVPVHLYGQPADMTPILEIADRHGLVLIEDAAQAHGAEYGGRRVGAIGDIACFSFYPGKNLGAYGDAGMVVTNNADLADKVRLLRNHGRKSKYEHLVEGFNARMDALHAAILQAKLPHLEEWNEARHGVASRYRELLSGMDIELPFELPTVRHVYHLFVIRVAQRDQVLTQLKARGIGAAVHYPIPLHMQPAYRHLGYERGSFPVAEAAAESVLSLPIYPELTEQQIQQVVQALDDIVEGVASPSW